MKIIFQVRVDAMKVRRFSSGKVKYYLVKNKGTWERRVPKFIWDRL